VEGEIDRVYDMREMKFREGFVDGVDDYFGGLSTLFMTSKIS